MLPWKYHALTPRDSVGLLLEVWNKYSLVSVASGGVASATWTVPKDKAALIYNFSGEITSADTPDELVLTIDGPGTAPISLALVSSLRPLLTGNQKGAVCTPCFVVAGPENIVSVSGYTVNSISLITGFVSLAAVLIPKGDALYV